ncbi:Piwi domain-containing protein [Paraphysoderma sedebokerense]|nr:Piwi domain-containing protein [Paraphysoderma sedebokerense]
MNDFRYSSYEMPLRPQFGTIGRPIPVLANYFAITFTKSVRPFEKFYHYEIIITPAASPTVHRQAFAIFLETYRDNLNRIPAAFDGKKSAITKDPWPISDLAQFEISMNHGNDKSPKKEQKPRVYKISIRKLNEYQFDALQDYLNGKKSGDMAAQIFTWLAALDTVFRCVPASCLTIADRWFFSSEGRIPVGKGTEMWPGFFQSVRTTQNKLILNVDVSLASFFESGNMANVAAKLLGRSKPEDLRSFSQHYVQLERLVKGLKVRVTHRKNHTRVYKILRLTSTSASATMFNIDNTTKQQSVAQYFQKQYKLKLKYPWMSCIVVGDIKKQVYFPMEVCEVMEGQKYNSASRDRATVEILKNTINNPQERRNRIVQSIQYLQSHSNELLHNFNLSVERDLIQPQGRVLEPPPLRFHPSSNESICNSISGMWNLRDKKFAHGGTLKSWSVLPFVADNLLPLQTTQKYIQELVKAFVASGIDVINSSPPILPPADPSIPGNVEASLKHAYLMAGNAAQSAPQLIICILPDQGPVLYGEIKRVGDTEIGVFTSCIQMRNVIQIKRNHLQHIAMKTNAKLPHGRNVEVPKEFVSFINEKPTIVFGCDVTHPGQGSQAHSIAAVVASMDNLASYYLCTTRLQPPRQEIVSDMGSMVVELLRKFYQTSGSKPERILFYRDGVSEGQFAEVIRTEVTAIKRACKVLDPDFNPSLTLIVAQKRHHTRFFPVRPEDADRTGNCPVGLVVDNKVTHPFEFDFVLLSHPGIQGVSRPMKITRPPTAI